MEKYARYSGIAFQMIAIILGFVWAGKKLDKKFSNGKSTFVIIFSLAGVAIAMYVVIKEFLDTTRKK
jgi:geranylgeranyl pyrophosphate synthase